MTGVASTCTRPLPTRGAVGSSPRTSSAAPFRPGFRFSVELTGFSSGHNNAGLRKLPANREEHGSDMIRVEESAMKPTLKPGLAATKKIAVDEPRVINFMGEDCRVYATPRIISDVEYTCRDFLLGHLDPGEDSVGTKVNWEHVGPALLGAGVSIAMKLIQVGGRRATFGARVYDGRDPVG